MRAPAILFLAALTVASARDRGELRGLIQDTSGGALVSALVTAMDQDSGIRRSGRTDGTGAYVFASLPAGEYKVSIRKPGFQSVMRWNVKVDPGQKVRLDFAMTVGSMKQLITIEGGPSLMNTQDASTGTRFGREAIDQLPVSGRGVLGLIELTPGLVATPAASGEPGQFSANGQRANTNYITIDGVSANGSITGTGLPAQFAGAALPAVTAFGSTENLAAADALDEVHVLTSDYGPELGRLPGAQVVLTTRSGSDQFHGAAWYALRNEALDANDQVASDNGLDRARLRLNEWSATLGGPLRRNRTFFFGSYGGLRFEQPYTILFATPSEAARANAPASLQSVLNAFPLPSGRQPTGLIGERIGHFFRPSRLDAASLRIDHTLTDRITLFGRFSRAPSYTESGFTEIEHFWLRSSGLTLGLNAMPSASLSIDIRANISRAAASSEWSGNSSSGGRPIDFARVLGAPAGMKPAFYGIAIGGIGAVYSGAGGRSRQGQINLVDTLTFRQRSHVFRAGLDYERLTPVRESAYDIVIKTWPNLAFALTGAPGTVMTTFADQSSAVIETLSLFAQDTWSASPRLTITYGVRWEITPPPAYRSLSGTSLQGSIIAAPIPGSVPVTPITEAPWETRYAQFAPRIGVTYRLGSHTVLRAGWGICYDAAFSTALDPINAFPFNRWQFGSGSTSGTNGSGNYGFRTAQDLKLPYVSEWNVAYERMFGVGNLVSVAYVGSAGRRLLRNEGGLASGTPVTQSIVATNNGASNYNGLELQYRRRIGRGLQGTASYTWSHAIDNGSYDSGLYLTDARIPRGSDRATASFDVRQNFTAGFSYAPLRNWELAAMFRARSGFPIDVLTTESFLGLGFDNVTRPDILPGVPLWLSSSTIGGRRLNPAAFSAPSGIQGTLGRNAITGAGMWQLDLSVGREFPIAERTVIDLRLQAFNALNHPNAADPVRFLDSPYFGTATSMLNLMLGSGTARSGLAPLFQIGSPRSLQVSVRIRF